MSNQALLTISLDPISHELVIANRDSICKGLKPSIKVTEGRLEVISKGRKGHSPRDWGKLVEERKEVDNSVGTQVRYVFAPYA